MTASGDLAEPELVPLCKARLQVGEMFHLSASPGGERMIGEVTASRWEGERFAATQRSSGSDWLVHEPAGMARIDVRLVLETDDGALVAVSYVGRSDLVAGHITSSPWFETADERYAWLNRMVCVGRGRYDRGENTVHYDVYEVR